MKLYLVQHGKAFDESQDPKRALSPEGLEQTQHTAKQVKDKIKEISNIYYSEKLRSKQTAEVFHSHLASNSKCIETKHLAPNDNPHVWLKNLEKEKSDVMLVSHLPFINRLLSLLLAQKEDQNLIKFENSKVICLEKTTSNQWCIDWIIK